MKMYWHYRLPIPDWLQQTAEQYRHFRLIAFCSSSSLRLFLPDALLACIKLKSFRDNKL
ncbi:Outer membrane protein (Associated with virulence) [Salmonella enterica subsp. enterica serovar Newport str. USMARC-S3124.1]|nr:Outer membrane protein (Associated with virulence) [Salmonella enterica subsp. enterica serovar Newport str. USMARC-S3124.1]